MYIPHHFNMTDANEAIAFMQRYSFAMLVNTANSVPLATHLPFFIKQDHDRILLSSHMAKANTQSAILTESTCLVIFTEPHAYISPQHYEKQQNVPTWNYMAVHAYGNADVIEDEEEQLLALEQMIASYDKAYLEQWATLATDYKLKMCKGITAFNITITDLQGKKKLSQNRSAAEQQNIIQALSNSTDHHEQVIAQYMQSSV